MDKIIETSNKIKHCYSCDMDIVSKYYCKHNQTLTHLNKKKLRKTIILPDEKTIDLQNIKIELLQIKLDIEQLINKIDKIKNE